MKFLEEIAELIISRYSDQSGEITIVFPNRRAGLFFQKYLSARISKPIWSPKILGIEDFIKSLSTLKSADKLELIFDLYQVFKQSTKSKETFDNFFFWGNIMLQDFDELDKFLVDPTLLFKNLAYIKDLENSIDYLQEEQKQLIKDFWKNFQDKLSSHKEGFLGVWDKLLPTYQQFQKRLYEKGIGYNGMIYRDVAHELKIKQCDPEVDRVIFAGFNALSKSEESIISWFVEEGRGEVYWDADDYYFKDSKQEAGRYLREMKFQNQILRGSFKESYGNAFIDSNKTIEVISVASDVGQAQHVSTILNSNKIAYDERTALILPNNELLFPLLHALPEGVENLNITMGYPLSSSPIFGFLETLIDLQLRAESKSVFHFRSVLTLFRHPVLAMVKDDVILKFEKEIVKNNSIWISKRRFSRGHEVMDLLFSDPELHLAGYLMDIVSYLAEKNHDDVEREFFFRFYTLLSKLNEFIQSRKVDLSKAAFQKLFRQMVQAERLPFEGEPLLGLQVMGILETRNLDFDTIIVLSMNETLIPPAPKNTSFIPYSIRKVFQLPVVDHQDAIYAYVFYRLVQRANNIFFLYNSTEETGKSGELSRFVRQLEQESNLKIVHKTISSEVTLEEARIISIEKSDEIINSLLDFSSKQNYRKRLTPTALNTYLECSLRFYLRYVLQLYEQEDISEDVDAMVFGNILHHVMEQLYLPFDTDGKRTVTATAIAELERNVDIEIEREFAKHFGSEEKRFNFEGQNILAREIIRKMVLKVLDYDKTRVPFDILGLEADESKGYVLNLDIERDNDQLQIGIKGIIDRIELKEKGVRIIDYKTGKDKKNFIDVDSLFDRENKNRNKAVFQTMIYGLLYSKSTTAQEELPIQASLFNIRELFTSNFSPLIEFNRREVRDIRIHLVEFEKELQGLLEEIFNRDFNFSQTKHVEKCRYCPYIGICNR